MSHFDDEQYFEEYDPQVDDLKIQLRRAIRIRRSRKSENDTELLQKQKYLTRKAKRDIIHKSEQY